MSICQCFCGRANIVHPYFAALALIATVWSAPARAEIDLSGNWAARIHQDWQERTPGPEIVDYMGLPINNEARAKALSYQASELSMPERQCMYYPPAYLAFGPFGFKMWSEFDSSTGKILVWKMTGEIDIAGTSIWMDGRPHPSRNAPHTFGGFTTGTWEGDVLVTYTTHFKAGYLRRNGVPLSDEATMTRHFARHGDLLTITEYIDDPVYLTEPEVVSRTWQMDLKMQVTTVPGPCNPEAEVARLTGDVVPHYLPGKNPFVGELTKLYNIPEETILGGAETMYPEYRKKLKDTYVPPARCVRYCCGWTLASQANTLKCIGIGFSTLDAPLGR
jgi:hypothetical protein